MNEETYVDINGREWGYIEIVRAAFSANPIEEILIYEDRKRFKEEYEKNRGAICPTCGKR